MSTLLTNEETMTQFLTDASSRYDRFKSDRETLGIDDKMRIADGLMRCLGNRTLATELKEEDLDEKDDGANVGSIRFFRMVNQKASLGYSVASAVEVPFKYTTTANPEVWGSTEEGASQAAIHNVLAKYAWKNGSCNRKMYEFWFQAIKYCSVPVQVTMHKEQRRVAVKNPETKKVTWEQKTVKSYPQFETLHWSMLYADPYAKNIADQECVVVLSIIPWMDIQKGVKNGWYDKDQVAEIRKNQASYKWDGAEGADAREAQITNSRGGSYSIGESELYLKWDVYQWAPIDGDTYGDEADYNLYWCTAIGNTLNNSIPVRMETDFDPDGEIPIEMIKVMPDDTDMLYSMTWAEAIRSLYSIEATLWNGTIDNIRGRQFGMMLYDAGQFDSTPSDFTYGPNKKHAVYDVDKALRDVRPPDVTPVCSQLISIIQEEQGVGAATNSNMMGQAYGGRTAASESLAINRFSQQPNLAEVSYVQRQFSAFVGRKFKSYVQAFLDPTMIRMIADEELDAPVYKDDNGYKLYGDFDVQVDVVDEFTDDYVQAGQELQLLQTVSGNEQLMESDEHKIHVGEWVKSIMRRLKVHNVDALVTPAGGADAKIRQRDEIRSMIETGEFIAPQEGEDHDRHLAVLDAEIMRWKPVVGMKLDPSDQQGHVEQQRADNILTLFLYPHKEAHEQMQLTAKNAEQQQSVRQPDEPPTEGQVAGNEMAGMLGGIQPQ